MLNLESQDIKNQKINELEQIEELKSIFPEIFEDGKINISKLKDVLFDIEEDKSENYSFNWFGKKDCYKIIKEKSNATLKKDEDENILDGDNVFIEGDNLEVLKLLQTSYHKKVKMIYIDPPYNKDKDFVYKDTWKDSIDDYLVQTGQKSDEGYTTSKEQSTGRRHTNWLNMIYPRLWLSRNLLKDDGVIFVSIDDDEVHNLRKVMDEIYGEENFVEQIIWKKRAAPPNDKVIASTHEYIVIYAKNKDFIKLYRQSRNKEQLSRYKNPDNHPKGKWIPDNLMANVKGGRFSKSLYFPIVNPYTNEEHYPSSNGNWRYSRETIRRLEKEDALYFGENKKGRPKLKRFLCDVQEGVPFSTDWNNVGYGNTATREVSDLFGSINYFETPKPVTLLKDLMKLSSKENDIILDFFAGSGTTAHAVMDLNKEDNGNRKYILVQLPEATDEKSEAYKNGYKKISDITKERIKRVIEKLDYKDGFKSYFLDKSNFQVFSELKKRPNSSFEEIMKMLKMSVFNENIFTKDVKEINIVIEIGLKNGFTLSSKTEEFTKDNNNFIRLYEDEKEFYFCFDKEIKTDIQKSVPPLVKLICYDKALDDSTKLNLRENIDLETL